MDLICTAVLNAGAANTLENFYLAVCRPHELVRERVRTITFFSLSYVSLRSLDLVYILN